VNNYPVAVTYKFGGNRLAELSFQLRFGESPFVGGGGGGGGLIRRLTGLSSTRLHW